jgi:phosphohistidine phosphatase SixA
MRHGIAAPDDGGDSFDPPLTAAGEDLIRREALGLIALGLRPEAIAASPLRRAQRTAELVGESLDSPQVPLVASELSPGCGLLQLEELFAGAAAARLLEAESILLVGHHPDLGSIASKLIESSHALSLARGGVCALEVVDWPPRPPARLVMLLPPQVLATLR